MQINHCAHAVEKYYNSGRCRYTIDQILAMGLYSDAFSLFMELGKQMQSLQKPYQPHQLFALIKEVVKQDENIVEGLMNYDYYKIFKQKPKMFLKNKISSEKRKEIISLFLNNGMIEEEKLYHYAHIDTIYYQQQLGYQLVLYNNQQAYPIRYFISENKEVEVIV